MKDETPNETSFFWIIKYTPESIKHFFPIGCILVHIPTRISMGKDSVVIYEEIINRFGFSIRQQIPFKPPA